jgi:predicted nucleic acid-binding protein
MNRTIVSLALLKVNWSEGVDYIDCFLPLLVSTLISQKIKSVEIADVSVLRKGILGEYGLDIPSSALITIINRAKKRGYFNVDNGIYTVNEEKLKLDDNTKVRTEIDRAYNHVVSEIQKFCTEKAPEGISFTNDQISDGLLAFLKNHDVDISFGASELSILPRVEAPEKLRYLICWFVVENWENNPTLVNYLQDIAIGHALSSIILYDEFSPFQGKLEKLEIYLDTPFFLSLLGINGEQRTLLSEEIIDQLKKEKCRLYILQTTISEVLNNLDSCKNVLRKGNGTKQSLSVRRCIEHNISVEDLDQMIADFSSLLEKWEISENQVPDYEDYELVIDEEELFDTILESYETINRGEKEPRTLAQIKKQLPEYIENTIRRDVKVLSGIYRFRKGKTPISIKDAKAIFVTTSSALAFASQRFEKKLLRNRNAIPTCFTDIFLSTLIWIQNPILAKELNRKRILSDCYAGMSPSDDLIKQYASELKKLQDKGRINSTTYLTLRTHHSAQKMLSNSTLGDPELFKGESASQLVAQFLNRITQEETEKRIQIEKEKETLQTTNDELAETILSNSSHITRKANTIGSGIANMVLTCFYIFIAFSFIIGVAAFFIPTISNAWQVVAFVILTLLTIFGFTHKFSSDSIRNPIIKYVKNKIVSIFTSRD